MVFLLELLMHGYFKRYEVDEMESSNNLPENALEWVKVIRKKDPKFTYKFVNT